MDPFRSSTLSIILTWIFSLPIFIGIAKFILNTIKKTTKPEKKFKTLFFNFYEMWIIVCFFIFSPFLYFILNLLMGIAFIFQDIKSIFLAFTHIYIPIIFIIYYAILLLIPILLSLKIIGFKFSQFWKYLSEDWLTNISRSRILLSSVITPVLFAISSIILIFTLRSVASITHSLKAENVIRSTNGPPTYYYQYILDKAVLSPPLPKFFTEMDLKYITWKDKIRAHVASYYLSDKELTYYLKNAYPEIK